jgi:hypothetical protein
MLSHIRGVIVRAAKVGIPVEAERFEAVAKAGEVEGVVGQGVVFGKVDRLMVGERR